MKFSLNNRVFLIIGLIVICCCFCTLLNAWVPITARRGVILLVGGALFLLFTPSIWGNKYFLFLVLYSIIVFLNHVSGDEYFRAKETFLLEVVMLLFAVCSSFCFLQKSSGTDWVKPLTLTFFIIIGITTIGTIAADIISPGIVRTAALYSFYGDTSLLNRYYRIGMSNYSLPHALPALIPPLVMGIKNREISLKRRIIPLLFLSAILVLIWLSRATTPIVLAVFALCLSVIVVPQNNGFGRILFIILLLAIVLPFLFIDDLFVSLLSRVIDVIQSTSDIENGVADRLIDIRESILAGDVEGDVEGRSDLYNISITSFFTSPIWGTNSGFGGHSAILDRMASLGIIGVLPLIGLFSAHLQMVMPHLKKEAAVYYYIGLISGLLMLLLKNMMNLEMVIILLLYLPIITFGISSWSK